MRNKGIRPLNNENENTLPPTDSLPAVARSPGVSLDTGAAPSYLKDKKEYLKKYRSTLQYKERVKVYRERARVKFVNDPLRKNKSKLYQHEYYLRNREKVLTRTHKRQKENQEHEKLRQKLYYQSHKENYIKRAKKYQQQKALLRVPVVLPTPEEIRNRKNIRSREWAKKNPERLKYLNKRWKSEHKDIIRIRDNHKRHQRRAQKKCSSFESKLIISWMKIWKNKKTVSCYWCQSRQHPSLCHLDHIIPLALGGTHSMNNLCISCVHCNQKKHSKALSIWNTELNQPVLF